jgi:DNA-binding MarR family transcriptional regulator
MNQAIGTWLVAREAIRNLSCASQKVLLAIFEHPGSTNKEIARKTFMSENSISVTLASLEQKQLILPYRRRRNTHWVISDLDALNALRINSRKIDY